MRVEPHPATAAFDALVVDLIKPVDRAVGRAQAEQRIERGKNLCRGGAVAGRQPREHHRIATAEEAPGIDRVDPGAAREHGDEQRGIAFLRQGADHRLIGASGGFHRPRQGGNRGVEAAAFIVARKQRLRGAFQRQVVVVVKVVAQRRGDGMNQRNRVFGGKIVILDPEPAITVAAAAARHGQRHRRFGNRGILVPDHRGDERIGAALHAGRQLLFVGAAQQQRDQPVPLEQAAIAKAPVNDVAAGLGPGREQRRQSGDDLVGDVADQAAQHRRHQRAFFVGQPAALVEEEIGTRHREPVASRAGTRGLDRAVGCRCSKRPVHRHHAAVIEQMGLTWRQSRLILWRMCWTRKKLVAA